MNETVIYNVGHLEAYGFLVLMYFFLGGMSGGSFLVSAFSKIYGKEKYRTITNIGAICALVFTALGGLCLLLDLGRQPRVFYLFYHFSITSPISWGTLIISLFFICTSIYLYYLLIARDDIKAHTWAKIGIVLAIALASYTGLLLSMARARPLWHSAIMAPLFLVSSGISGLAIVLLIANLMGKSSPDANVIQRLGKILAILILIDIFFLSDMYVLYVGIAEAQEIAQLLLFGKFAFLFWGIELLIGSIVPVILLQTKKFSDARGFRVSASILALVGVFTMRYIIVIIGQYLPLS